MRRSVWSPVAWELAHHATFDTTDAGKVRATLATFTLLTPLIGVGNTTTEAMQDLALAIDRYGTPAPIFASGLDRLPSETSLRAEMNGDV